MNFAFTTPHQQTRKYIVFISFLVFSTFFTSYYGNAQIDIKSKVDAQTYAEYSQVIDLLSKTFPYQGSSLTIFIPDNYSINRINSDNYNKIFVQNNLTDVTNYLNKYVLNEKLLLNSIESVINTSVGFNKMNLNNETLYFTKHRELVMVSNNISYEAHVKTVLNFNTNISVVFLLGGF